MQKEGEKIVKTSRYSWGNSKIDYKILEIVKITKSGRMNLSDGTVLNPNYTERGGDYGAFSYRPTFQPLTEELMKVIEESKKRDELARLLGDLKVEKMDASFVDQLLSLIKENRAKEEKK